MPALLIGAAALCRPRVWQSAPLWRRLFLLWTLGMLVGIWLNEAFVLADGKRSGMRREPTRSTLGNVLSMHIAVEQQEVRMNPVPRVFWILLAVGLASCASLAIQMRPAIALAVCARRTRVLRTRVEPGAGRGLFPGRPAHRLSQHLHARPGVGGDARGREFSPAHVLPAGAAQRLRRASCSTVSPNAASGSAPRSSPRAPGCCCPVRCSAAALFHTTTVFAVSLDAGAGAL